METLKNHCRKLVSPLSCKKGQAVVEYVLIVAAIAVAATYGLQTLGTNASNIYNNMANTLASTPSE